MLAAWKELNPPSAYPTCYAYSHAEARFMASPGAPGDEGFHMLGFEAFGMWRDVHPFRDYRETMTYREYDAMCREKLAELMAAARAGG